MQEETTQTKEWQREKELLSSQTTFYPVVVSLILVTVAVGFALPIVFPNQYPARPEAFGANWGIATLSGQWWRLLSYSFVHITVVHLAGNMAALWILGTRIEKAWGHWIVLLTYLSCGVTAGVWSLALYPKLAPYGASASVMGLAGALCVIYGLRFRSLSWRTRCKLSALVVYSLWLVWRELTIHTDAGHIAGLSTGIAVAFFFTYFATTPRTRYWTFAGMLVLLVLAGALIRHHYRVVGLLS
jgi:membrane associated rhomboid family serine protease